MNISANRPDLIYENDALRRANIIDISVPSNNNARQKAAEKRLEYTPLSLELKRLWDLKYIVVVPIIIGSLGCTGSDLIDAEEIVGGGRMKVIQRLTLCGTSPVFVARCCSNESYVAYCTE